MAAGSYIHGNYSKVTMAKSKCRLPQWEEKGVRRFFSRFEMCCDLNKWEEDKDKVGQLVPLLSDKVFDFVSGLSATDRSKYDIVKKKLLAEYEDTELEVTYADQFGARKLIEGEDLTSLMMDLKRLVIKGYPSFSEADRAKLVNNQFMKSLSPGARKHLLLNPVKEEAGGGTMASCDNLLTQARLIDQIERVPSKETTSEKSTHVAAVTVSKNEEQMSQMISAVSDLTKMVHEVLSTPSVAGIQQSGSSRMSAARSTRGPFRGQCFNCDEFGHLARDCPKPKRGRASTCRVCGNPGHTERDCALTRRQTTLTCKLCGNSGHTEERCAMKGRLPPLN